MIVLRRKKPVDARINLVRGNHPSVPENSGDPILDEAGGEIFDELSAVLWSEITPADTIQAVGAGTMTYSIVAGNDGASFNIDSSAGALSFASTPDYETPADANADNVYLVTIKATNDSSLTDQRLLRVTVTDVAE